MLEVRWQRHITDWFYCCVGLALEFYLIHIGQLWIIQCTKG